MARLRIGSAGRGLAHVLLGTIGAQVLLVAALPFLSRLYTPEQFGYFSLILALAGLVAPSATFRFETAAMLPEKDSEVRALAWNAILACLGTAVVFGTVLQILASNGIGELGRHPYLPAWAALMVALTGLYSLLSQLALRKREYALIARRSFTRSFATAVSQVALGLIGRTGDGLVVGGVIGNAVGISSMYLRTRELLRFPSRGDLRRVWRTYWRFPAVFAPSALLNSAGLQAPIIFFTFWFGIAAGGQLGMAERLVGIPLTLVGAAVGQVIDAEISKRIREGAEGLRHTYLRISLALAALGALVAIVFGWVGGWLVPWILGDQWVLAGQMVQILAVTSGIRLVASPLSRFLLLLQKSLVNTVLDIVRVVLMLGSMVVVMALQVDLAPALWLVYSALAVTYIATWICGLSATASSAISDGTLARGNRPQA